MPVPTKTGDANTRSRSKEKSKEGDDDGKKAFDFLNTLPEGEVKVEDVLKRESEISNMDETPLCAADKRYLPPPRPVVINALKDEQTLTDKAQIMLKELRNSAVAALLTEEELLAMVNQALSTQEKAKKKSKERSGKLQVSAEQVNFNKMTTPRDEIEFADSHAVSMIQEDTENNVQETQDVPGERTSTRAVRAQNNVPGAKKINVQKPPPPSAPYPGQNSAGNKTNQVPAIKGASNTSPASLRARGQKIGDELKRMSPVTTNVRGNTNLANNSASNVALRSNMGAARNIVLFLIIA